MTKIKDSVTKNLLTRHSRGHSTPQGGDCCHGDLLSAVLLGAGVAGGDHVGFEQRALQVDVVVRQRLVDRREHLASEERAQRRCSGVFVSWPGDDAGG